MKHPAKYSAGMIDRFHALLPQRCQLVLDPLSDLGLVLAHTSGTTRPGCAAAPTSRTSPAAKPSPHQPKEQPMNDTSTELNDTSTELSDIRRTLERIERYLSAAFLQRYSRNLEDQGMALLDVDEARADELLDLALDLQDALDPIRDRITDDLLEAHSLAHRLR